MESPDKQKDNEARAETVGTARAADLLHLSRAQLLKLLEAGTIRSTRIARHRRVITEDLQRYAIERRAECAARLDELASADAEYLR